MESAPLFHVDTVLILKADRLYAEGLRQMTLRVFPRARVNVVTTIEAAALQLATQPVDLFVTGLGPSLEGDVLDLLLRNSAQRHRPDRVLVVTSRREYRLLAALRGLAINGVFDSAHEPPEAFTVALRTIAEGARYWSQSVLGYMERVNASSSALFRLLTVFEELVLSVIGDGCDDSVAARELGVSPATISTVRRELHRKLGVQHRGELVRFAAQHGFVHFTPSRIIRPGFTLLASAYQPRRGRRTDAAGERERVPLACAGR